MRKFALVSGRNLLQGGGLTAPWLLSPGLKLVLQGVQMLHVFLAAPLDSGYMMEPGTDQHQSGVAVWEGSNHPRPAPNLPVHPFDHIVGSDLRPVLRGKVAVSTPKIEMMNPEFSPAAIVGSIPCGTPDEREAQVEEYLPLSVSFFWQR